MKIRLFACLAVVCAAGTLRAAAPEYTVAAHWLKPKEGSTTIGDCHGDVAVSSTGDVYVSVRAPLPTGGIQVFAPDGKYLRHVEGAPNDFHGFVIHQEDEGEFIYGSRLGGGSILKMQLDGKVVLEIPGSMIPDEFKVVGKNGKRQLRLTAVDVAPDGKIYSVDGYSSDYIHVFAPNGEYLKSFGGRQAPTKFKTCHKIAIDTRFDPPQIICCDRENRRVVQLSLDGEVLQVIEHMKRPAAVAIYGDLAAVAEIEGRLSLLDKDGNTVLTLGANDVKAQTATNAVKPEQWRPGILTAPHGVDFAPNGDLLVSEYNKFGRVLRWDLQK